MKSFSQRQGLEAVPEAIQVGGMNDALRNSLWNVLDLAVWSRKDFMYVQYGEAALFPYSQALWFHHFKQPFDQRARHASDVLKAIRSHFFAVPWNKVYEFLEFTVAELSRTHPRLPEFFNTILERELAGYRFIDGLLVDITDEQEVAMLSEALADSKFAAPTAHLRRALELLGNREAPDHRNSIKESISAVESMARIVSGKEKATLGDALKTLEQKRIIHPALKDGYLKIYGYTSDEQGIRHAMLDEPVLAAADSKYFLLSCTSFVNYLKAQL